MHLTNRSRWQHSHDYAADSSVAERRTRIVIGIKRFMRTFRAVALNPFPAPFEPRKVCSLIVRLKGDATPLRSRVGFLAESWPTFPAMLKSVQLS